MKVVLAGPKAAGKSSIGKLVAERLGINFIETDAVIEELFAEESVEKLSCREIWKRLGEEAFRALERRAVQNISEMDWCVISTGGSTLLNPESRRLLRHKAIVVYLTSPAQVLWERMEAIGLPPFLQGPEGKEEHATRLARMEEAILPIADVVIDSASGSLSKSAERVIRGIEEQVILRADQPNTFGDIIRVTTFGESHGPAVGAVLDGVKPGVSLSEEDVQKELDRRRPGQSSVTTPRSESDTVHILSGVFEGKTTGAPIAMVVYNKDQDSSKYDALRDLFRPGHADLTFWAKYGIRDHRGGGRSSGRETVGRVAGGAVAKKILAERGINIVAYALEIAGVRAETIDFDQIEKNPVRCPDPEAAARMEAAILAARAEKDSVGGIVQLEITGIPAGLGDPVFRKLDARLGAALFSIGAVKGVEFGAGFAASRMRGSENNDQMQNGEFLTNHAGGILGGMSSGAPIIARAAIKPTPSIAQPQSTIDTSGENREVTVHGRHDPCIVPRVVPVIEAMAALVVLDAMESQLRVVASG